ncbi:MAG: alpha/beta hydrolase [Patescibacteria group bacterium]|nr:alpha/beta hydrolase [Patescibacteria group bacterium]
MARQLLIIPGWGGTKESWKNFIALAQKDFEVFCLDLPCFGSEPCPKEIWGVEDYTNFIIKKIKDLNLIKPVVLGHSFGGQVAAYLAATSPQLISRLILSGASAIRPKRSFKRAIFSLIAKTGKIILSLPLLSSLTAPAKKILYRLADSPDYTSTNGIQREIFKKITRQDLTEELKKIKIPTLVVWGEKDTYVPLTGGKKIAALIPNSRLEIIPEGKHGLHLQMPEKLYGLVKNFID